MKLKRNRETSDPDSREPENNSPKKGPSWFYSPPGIRYNEKLSITERYVLEEIYSLSYQWGYCCKNDTELGARFGLTRTSFNRLCSNLCEKGFLKRTYDADKQGTRQLTINWDHPDLSPHKPQKGCAINDTPMNDIPINDTQVSHSMQKGCIVNDTHSVLNTSESKLEKEKGPLSPDQKIQNTNTRSIELLDWFNECLKRFQLNEFEITEKRIQAAAALLNAHRFTDVTRIIKFKCLQWRTEEKMRPHLRPDTLFKPDLFTKYLEEIKNQPAREWTERSEADDALPSPVDDSYPY